MPDNADPPKYDYDIAWQQEHADVKGYSGVAVDSHDNIYACGVAPDEEHGVVVKYSPDGDLEWTDMALPKPLDVETYRSIAGGSDALTAALPQEERYGAFLDIVVDLDDNVIVAGSFCRTEPLRIYIMVTKYRPDGTVVWSKEYTRRVLNHAMGVTVDGSGDVYLVGQGGIGATLLQPAKITLKALVMKVSGSTGAVLWTRTRKKGQYMWYHDAAIDSDGTLMVSGYYLDGGDIRPVISAFRGRLGLWTRYLVPPGRDKKAAGIARHPDGSFHIVGNREAAQMADITPYLMRFSSNLDIIWEHDGDTNAFLYGTAVLPDGVIIATGMHAQTSEYYAAVFDAASGEKIQDIFLGPIHASGVNFNDYLKGVAVDGDGDVVVAGAWNPGKIIKFRLTPAADEEVYTLQVQLQPQDGGTVSPPGGSFPAGREVTLQAQPGRGYQFSHWSGDASGSTGAIEITMDQDVSVTAHFTEEEPSWLDWLLQWLLGRR